MSTGRRDLADPFHPSFTGGRQESKWILDSVGSFYRGEWITDILQRVRGGKEATA